MVGTSYLLRLGIFAIHSDIHPAGFSSAAGNEAKPDSNAAEEQEDHARHHHSVLQVNYRLPTASLFLPSFFPLLSFSLKFTFPCRLVQGLWSGPQQRHQPVHHDLAAARRK